MTKLEDAPYYMYDSGDDSVYALNSLQDATNLTVLSNPEEITIFEMIDGAIDWVNPIWYGKTQTTQELIAMCEKPVFSGDVSNTILAKLPATVSTTASSANYAIAPPVCNSLIQPSIYEMADTFSSTTPIMLNFNSSTDIPIPDNAITMVTAQIFSVDSVTHQTSTHMIGCTFSRMSGSVSHLECKWGGLYDEDVRHSVGYPVVVKLDEHNGYINITVTPPNDDIIEWKSVVKLEIVNF